MNKILSTLILFITVVCPLSSQVTIGGALPANVGSLLDLKSHEPDSNNITATKGLLLPRVTLQKLSGDLAQTLGSTNIYSNEDHIGLLVYNISDSICPLFDSGLYVWDGLQWSGMNHPVPKDAYSYTENSDGTGIVTDYEGNKYTTKRFNTVNDSTNYNQVWMTQNLRSLKDANGVWINCPEGLNFNSGYNNISQVSKIITEIPDTIIGTYTNAGTQIVGQTYNSFIDEFGLLYANSVATRACPKGWHLPTWEEWETFLKAQGGIKSIQPNNSSDFLTIGNTMKKNSGSNYISVDSRSYTWGSLSPAPNGFNAVPAGYVDSRASSTKNFGGYTGFHGVRSIIVVNTTNTVSSSTTNYSLDYSVRCMKN